MKDVKLCPVCRKRYLEIVDLEDGLTMYVHRRSVQEELNKVTLYGCCVGEFSQIRGVSFSDASEADDAGTA
jgi:hypothetical protein